MSSTFWTNKETHNYPWGNEEGQSIYGFTNGTLVYVKDSDGGEIAVHPTEIDSLIEALMAAKEWRK